MSFLDEYEPISIKEFRGLYSKGLSDSVPIDHGSLVQNMGTNKTNDFETRPGTKLSYNVGHSVVRIFEAVFIAGIVTTQHVLTCDGAGHIYEDAGTLLLTVVNMVDFSAINLFNHVFILPILSSGSSFLYVWDGTNPPRQAAGNAPTSAMTVTVGGGGSGNIDVGTHQFAVAFVTNTGFTTQPGPKIAGVFTPDPGVFPDSTRNVVLTNVPLGPAGTTQRVILATKANLLVYYFVPNGTINDNVTTTITLNFFDTALAVDASDLFNLKESVPASVAGVGGGGLAIYHGRLVVLDGTSTDPPLLSYSGQAEAFSNVTGFLNVLAPDQSVSAFEYYGTLYICGNAGIQSTADNGNEPSSWPVNLIDTGVAFNHGSITNTLSQKPNGPLSANILGITREGLYIFNGTVQRPPLSAKIQKTWDRFTHGADHTPQLCVDVSRDIIYILLPVDGSVTPNLLLACDFTEGLTAEAVTWSVFSFPYTPQAIAMVFIADGDDFDYWLRIGKSTGVDKLTTAVTDDSGTAITSIYQTFLATPAMGALNIFRHLRFRAVGTGTMLLRLADEDDGNVQNPPSITLSTTPSKDFDRQINYTSEKMSVQVKTVGGTMKLKRIDIFCKERWKIRPG